MKKILLFLPPYSGPPLGPPAGLLSLAASLRSAGYAPLVLDAAVTPDWFAALERELPDSLCLGVSLLTGPMIQGAVRAAKLARGLRPTMPILFGGWHPSLLPEQTLGESFVDVVVRQQGELTLLEILRRMEAQESFEGVAGCSYRAGAEIRHNPDRPVERIENLPTPAYDLADFDAYERAGGGRKLPYASSVGCPYACNYCTDTVYYNRRFNAYSAERVVQDLAELVPRHRITEVPLLDSNFLVDVKRAGRIAAGILDAGLKIRWTFQASTDLLCRMRDEEVSLLARSGVTHIGFGTESASEEVLRKMNKKHQHIEDMFETARKCWQAGIRVTYNIIVGYPGETEADRADTWRVMGEIGERFDNVNFSPNVFTPYPGIPIWPELKRLGLEEPSSLEGWTRMALGGGELPWLAGSARKRLEHSVQYFLLRNRYKRWPLLARWLDWRVRHHFFGWPFDLALIRATRRLIPRRSLLTGQALGHSLEEACS